ncbi:DUF488 domain-containing protein [Ornithinimicrobium faecis]|uniref:DUF488 family protein n=1 Tax=Ornithinimicrobium faecis TaxID=2934158 RepID=A0ABY4YSF5_9MICO|nr:MULTISPECIES: DUF488 family protein [unclassified Ornithinimicrobium]USQ79293.1 DUF488 family protein [Ornithinimicrobium sp. HY1793]
MTQIATRRVYDGAPPGWHAILVDRVWPRGIAKDDLSATWLKEVGPSTELRTWFDHDPDKFEEFATRYRKELDGSDAFDELLKEVRGNKRVVLLYGAKDEEHNQAVVLADLLRDKL